jgi:hypothetical protein
VEDSKKYIVTVEFEVFAASRQAAVTGFLYDNERYMRIASVERAATDRTQPSVYQHEQSFYDDDGVPVYED